MISADVRSSGAGIYFTVSRTRLKPNYVTTAPENLDNIDGAVFVECLLLVHGYTVIVEQLII